MDPMRIEVRLFAALRERAGSEVLVLEDVAGPLDVAALKRELVRRHPELGSLDHVRGVLGTRYVPDDAQVSGAEPLSLLPPVSGGADAFERGVFELSPEPLDPGRAFERVGDAGCGGTCVFVGTTRERNRDQDVVKLDYEAFEAMAGPEMARIFRDCAGRFGPRAGEADGEPEDAELRLRMLVQHRTGTVGVGEASVVVAVASPHRDAAFRAARFLIDELKARLPVWKKEVYRDGHHWIGDRS